MIDHLSALPVLLPKICLLLILLIGLGGALWLLNMLFIQPLSDPLRHIPGPNGSLLESHLRQVMDPAISANTYMEWKRLYGQTFRFHGFGKHDYRILSFDFRVIAHILNSPIYEKPWQTRSFLGKLIGRGIFSMEGAEHKMQRRIIAPAFSSQSIKNMTPIFFRKAEELQDRWRNHLNKQAQHSQSQARLSVPEIDGSSSCGVVVDIARWISRASFDVIGLAGFSYDFNSLQDESEPVYNAYRNMFNVADKGLGFRDILELYFPIIRKFWSSPDIETTDRSLLEIGRIGRAIITQRKAAVQSPQINDHEDRDLLTLLIKSNISTDPSKRLTDQELLDQCSTFLLAGSDSVSVALSWCFYFLSLHPGIQTRLRTELRTSHQSSDGNFSDSSTDSGFHDCTSCNPHPLHTPFTCRCNPKTRWNAIRNLTYLDAVVRETLRFCPPVHGTIRVATQDDQIPISQAVSMSDGSKIGGEGCNSYISIRKGSYLHIPIEGLSSSEEIWGKNALDFDPDRWIDIQDWDPSKPGHRNLMTFGLGPHSCLGHKFTFAEIKIFVAIILPHFEFSPVKDIQISKFNTILTRPFVSGKWSAGTQLPVVVRELR